MRLEKRFSGGAMWKWRSVEVWKCGNMQVGKYGNGNETRKWGNGGRIWGGGAETWASFNRVEHVDHVESRRARRARPTERREIDRVWRRRSRGDRPTGICNFQLVLACPVCMSFQFSTRSGLTRLHVNGIMNEVVENVSMRMARCEERKTY